MSVLKRIVVGHDLRAGGDNALRSAAVLADRCKAALKVIHVIEPQAFYRKLSRPFTSLPSPEEIARKVGRALETRISSREFAHLEIQYEVCTGKPFVELIVARRAWEADLIVVGGPAQSQDRSLGSTGEHVIRKGLVPVLLTPKPLNANCRNFLVPTDFSAGAQKAATEAILLAESFAARICFIHVLDVYPLIAYSYSDEIFGTIPQLSAEDVEPEWSAFLASLNLKNVSWEKQTVEGVSATEILDQATALQADLIVMGTHGRTGLEHMLLGSVAVKVARSAPCPVLSVRPEAFPFSLP
jgi:nucleotide-binding universal stress UspA family protein